MTFPVPEAAPRTMSGGAPHSASLDTPHAASPDTPHAVSPNTPFDPSWVPEPVLPAAPALVRLYEEAWRQAWDHVTDMEGMAATPFMDEGFAADTIWIWDTCFMAHFCKYAPEHFPGIQSLDNFYAVMYEGDSLPVHVQHPDNPPLLAWTELEYARHTGDLERVRRVLGAGYLQRHLDFFDQVPRDSVFEWSNVPTEIERTPHGYRWNGVCSGMDNTPRASQQAEHGTFGNILWLDAAAQQALSAGAIAELERLVGRDELAEVFEDRRREYGDVVATHWDPEDRFYYDLTDDEDHAFHRVATPASYWPLLADLCDRDQAEALAARLEDPEWFGGDCPWPTVARWDPTFRGTGQYWRGGVWVPMAYMGARALADHGFHDLTRRTSRALLEHMARTFEEYEPHTIWECYAPDRPTPATGKDDVYEVRPDFCGWSALAPISMLIEHVLGFRVDALSDTVHWLRPEGVAGIRRLRCGKTSVDLLSDGKGSVTVTAGAPLTVVVDGAVLEVPAGTTTWQVPLGS